MSKKFEIVKTEQELIQKQVDKYDNLSAKIKTWTLTLWAALLGWSFQTKSDKVIFLAIMVVLFFWVLDAVNKNFRQNYRARLGEITHALETVFKTSNWPKEFSAPVLPHHGVIGVLKKIFRLHILLFYAPLVIVTIAMFFVA